MPWIFGFLLCAISACDTSRVYEDTRDLPESGWAEDSLLRFSFRIDQTDQAYNILYDVRNTASYSYYNLYVRFFLRDANDSLLLTRLDEMYLMHPKTGRPFGDGLGDILDHQIITLQDHHFPDTGLFTMEIQQYMRQDPLEGILAFGVRVEKAEVE